MCENQLGFELIQLILVHFNLDLILYKTWVRTNLGLNQLGFDTPD